MRLAQKLNRYTYADIEDWPENERWELIDGLSYNMTLPRTPFDGQ